MLLELVKDAVGDSAKRQTELKRIEPGNGGVWRCCTWKNESRLMQWEDLMSAEMPLKFNVIYKEAHVCVIPSSYIVYIYIYIHTHTHTCHTILSLSAIP